MNRIQNQNLPPIDPRLGRTQGAGGSQVGGAKSAGTTQSVDFREILQKEIGGKSGLRFSAHAQSRLDSRKIDLTPEAMERLNQAVDRAAEKGAKDALLLMPGASRGSDLALVVSVTNRTVITAMDGENMKENVFTNIDSAVVVS